MVAGPGPGSPDREHERQYVARFFDRGGYVGPKPLDNWLRTKIDGAAGAVGAHVVLPNSGPPFVPIQEWAARAEPVYRSPIGIMIHSEFRLWHAYRAALLFPALSRFRLAGRMTARATPARAKSCLKVCPADAFLNDRFDASACAAHLESHAGTNCRVGGCLARRACPGGEGISVCARSTEISHRSYAAGRQVGIWTGNRNRVVGAGVSVAACLS